MSKSQKIKHLNYSPKVKAFFALSLSLIALWLFLYVALEVTEDGTGDVLWMKFDRSIYESIVSLRLEHLSPLIISFTYIGSTIAVAFVAMVALIYFYFRKLFSDFRILLGASIGSMLFIQAAKVYFGRVRPSTATWLVPVHGLSFPSGHSAGSFAVLGALFYILGRSCEHRYQRFFLWSLGALLVLIIGFSRVYLGVHYPTDVIGGFLLGFAFLLFSIAVDSLFTK